jgi:hypothetical protein
VLSAVKGESNIATNLAANAVKLEGYSAKLHGDVLHAITFGKLLQGNRTLVRGDVYTTLGRLYRDYDDRLPGILVLEGLQATSEGRYEDAVAKHSAARDSWREYPNPSKIEWVRNMMFQNDFDELIALALWGKAKSEKGQALLRKLSSESHTKKGRRMLTGIKAFGRTTGRAFLLHQRMSFQFRRVEDYLLS